MVEKSAITFFVPCGKPSFGTPPPPSLLHAGSLKCLQKRLSPQPRLPTISQKSLSPHETSLKCLLSIQKKTKSTDIKSKRLSSKTTSPPPAKWGHTALPETKIASPPPSFLVREGRPILPFQKGNMGRNRPILPSRRAIWDDFGQRRAIWDAFGERPMLPSLTTNSLTSHKNVHND